jgi:uncharacterized membrane protein
MIKKAERIPPGWDYNPATWNQRIPIVVLAILGFGIALYLSLYQLEVIPEVWEPFFGSGSRTILNSKISHLLPIPDAALGAFGYLVDAVAGLIGGTHRWRRMPWIVIVFGLAVGPLGLVSVLLVVLQPVLFSAWCTLCLGSAVISVIMIGPAMDEMLAGLQYLKRAKSSNASTWRIFWGMKQEYKKVG